MIPSLKYHIFTVQCSAGGHWFGGGRWFGAGAGVLSKPIVKCV